jgi:hypothetical protein
MFDPDWWVYYFAAWFYPTYSLFSLGNHPPVLSPRSNRLTYRTSLHPVPKPLVRPRGAPFAHEVHSGAFVGKPNPGQRDPSSRQYHHQAHHRGCHRGCHQECHQGYRRGCHRGYRPTEHRPPGHGLLGKVDTLNFITKTVTNSCEQCNLELSTRRRRPNPMFNWHPKRHHHNVASSALARLALVDTSDTPFLMLMICDVYLRLVHPKEIVPPHSHDSRLFTPSRYHLYA